MLRAFLFFHLITGAFPSLYDDFCETSATNTVCRRKETECKPDPAVCKTAKEYKMTDEDRKWVLKAHNELRQKHANGEETKNPLKASDMNVLGYSLEIEYLCECHINECKFEHDDPRDSPNFKRQGQNLAEGKGTKETTFDPASIVKNWYGEVSDHKDGSKYVSKQATDHYTTVVWSRIKYIGCAKVFYSGKFIFGCNYYPAPNVEGSFIFKEGDPCSACLDEVPCNKDYRALCGHTPPFPMDPKFEDQLKALAKRSSSGRPPKTPVTLTIVLSFFIKFC